MRPLNTQSIEVDAIMQRRPQVLYTRFKRENNNTRVSFYYTLPYGYGYLLQEIIWKAPNFQAGEAITVLPDWKMELIKLGRGRKQQNEPYPMDLIGTPGKDSCITVAPAPVDDKNFSVCFQSKPPLINLQYNEIYWYNDTIEFHLTQKNIFFDEVNYIDFVVVGYLIPAKDLKLWEGRTE